MWNNLFSSFFFTWLQVLSLEAASPLFVDPVQRVGRNKKEKTGFKSNNSRCSISVSVRYASFQVLLSLCEIDSQRVENLCPCWHCCADTCCGLRCPWKPEELPPPLLLTEPISTPCSFVSSLFVLQNTYLAHSVQPWLCGFHNEMPRKFLHIVWELFLLLLATFWQVCAAEVQQKFFLSHLLFVVTLSCEFYMPQMSKKIICIGCFLSCPRCSSKLFFLSAATELKRNSAQKRNCSLTAGVSLKACVDRTHS